MKEWNIDLPSITERRQKWISCTILIKTYYYRRLHWKINWKSLGKIWFIGTISFMNFYNMKCNILKLLAIFMTFFTCYFLRRLFPMFFLKMPYEWKVRFCLKFTNIKFKWNVFINLFCWITTLNIIQINLYLILIKVQMVMEPL